MKLRKEGERDREKGAFRRRERQKETGRGQRERWKPLSEGRKSEERETHKIEGRRKGER